MNAQQLSLKLRGKEVTNVEYGTQGWIAINFDDGSYLTVKVGMGNLVDGDQRGLPGEEHEWSCAYHPGSVHGVAPIRDYRDSQEPDDSI